MSRRQPTAADERSREHEGWAKNFLCPSCRTPLPRDPSQGLVTCTQCSVQVDLTRVDTAPGQARLWPEVDLRGETLGGHALRARLGSGGMGTVYEAESPAGRVVAVKVLSPMLAAEPALRERFRREVRSLTAVKHPRVVQLFEQGEDRGFCWYSMEQVAGADLRQRLEKGVMPPAEVEALAASLLEALSAVHDAGMVHRDLKPANVLLAPDGPRLCDFGIAQVSGATTLRESAALVGSLRSMAPEQRWGQADRRSDLFSLGVVLHECFSRGVPGEQPLPQGTPRHLAQFIERLTHQNPKRRPGSAGEAPALAEGHVTAAPRRRWRPRRGHAAGARRRGRHGRSEGRGGRRGARGACRRSRGRHGRSEGRGGRRGAQGACRRRRGGHGRSEGRGGRRGARGA
ncbi:MAG: protein kinase, partial [Myxococcaceae bacterium]|nr:protein kinase [Myxococcaceae bacterium]